MEKVQYDRTGKLNLSTIYDRPDPVSYFSTLSQLDYAIPQAAKPLFARLIAARRSSTGRDAIKVVDLGCSYGVNGALLKYGLSMATLYRLYGNGFGGGRGDLVKRDRAIFDDPVDDDLQIVGIDQAGNAVDYAVDAGSLDGGLAADLERDGLTPPGRRAVGDADLIISTGCFGYVTERSLELLLEAAADTRPWMAHFVLRMFSFDAARAMLERHGYITEKADGLYRQRRFVSQDERRHVLDNLAAAGIDPAGAEATGWYFAELHVARPREKARKVPLAALLDGAVAVGAGEALTH
ncbi:class I SAM-dependent methyltransferase [Mesorhizobium xinjiangense]|uniref:class I SAM-dependent methyltransferase n=1 Tax=Mesorhizobium xinjiangense TaxID=2678685 RepID=UPI0012ED0998|nr:class I SAM-dependent methyltransferase [Mesorhizobium xinjiangense]